MLVPSNPALCLSHSCMHAPTWLGNGTVIAWPLAFVMNHLHEHAQLSTSPLSYHSQPEQADCKLRQAP